MSYGRASSDDALGPEIIRALANKMGLDVSLEEAEILTSLLMDQLAAAQSFDVFDLQDVVPATVFDVEGAWHE